MLISLIGVHNPLFNTTLIVKLTTLMSFLEIYYLPSFEQSAPISSLPVRRTAYNFEIPELVLLVVHLGYTFSCCNRATLSVPDLRMKLRL